MAVRQSFREALETLLGRKGFAGVELTAPQVWYHEGGGGQHINKYHINKLATKHVVIKGKSQLLVANIRVSLISGKMATMALSPY